MLQICIFQKKKTDSNVLSDISEVNLLLYSALFFLLQLFANMRRFPVYFRHVSSLWKRLQRFPFQGMTCTEPLMLNSRCLIGWFPLSFYFLMLRSCSEEKCFLYGFSRFSHANCEMRSAVIEPEIYYSFKLIHYKIVAIPQ